MRYDSFFPFTSLLGPTRFELHIRARLNLRLFIDGVLANADQSLSNHVLGQPFFPLGRGEAAADTAFLNALDHASVSFKLSRMVLPYVEENSGRDMHPDNSIRLSER